MSYIYSLCRVRGGKKLWKKGKSPWHQIMRGGQKTRPVTRLPQSRAGGQGQYSRSLDYLGMSSEANDRKKGDQPTDQPTDQIVNYKCNQQNIDYA